MTRLLYIIASLFFSTALCAQEYRIAAVVNGKVISTLDIEERANLLLRTTDLGKEQMSAPTIQREVLSMLIDEELKKSEAQRFNITASEQDITQGIEVLERRRGRPPGSLLNFLQENNISERTFRRQIGSDIAWNKYVARRLRASVNVNDEDVRMMQRQIAMDTRSGNNAEVVIKQIVLSLKPDAEFEEVDILMDIAREVARYPGDCMQQGIAGVQDFEDLDINVEFKRTTYLNISPQIRPLVESLGVTDISEPFATPDGIHLLMLCERIDLPPVLPPEDKVRMAMFQEKLTLEAERHLRKLRREAFIDIKI